MGAGDLVTPWHQEWILGRIIVVILLCHVIGLRMSMWEDIGQWGLKKVCVAGSGKDFSFVKKDAIQRFPFPSSHLVVWGCDAWSCYSYLITAAAAKSLQLYLTLCDPMDCSLSASSVHGILQARVLEWVAIAFSSSSLKVCKSRDKDGTMKLPEPLCH